MEGRSNISNIESAMKKSLSLEEPPTFPNSRADAEISPTLPNPSPKIASPQSNVRKSGKNPGGTTEIPKGPEAKSTQFSSDGIAEDIAASVKESDLRLSAFNRRRYELQGRQQASQSSASRLGDSTPDKYNTIRPIDIRALSESSDLDMFL